MVNNSRDKAAYFGTFLEEPVDLVSALAGDRGGAEGVLRWIRPLVVRYCRAHVGAQERAFASADDIAQEVCIAVFTALPRYRDQGRPFLAFVYGIAAHKVADAHRSSARNHAEPVLEIPDLPDLSDDPEAHVMKGELGGVVRRGDRRGRGLNSWRGAGDAAPDSASPALNAGDGER